MFDSGLGFRARQKARNAEKNIAKVNLPTNLPNVAKVSDAKQTEEKFDQTKSSIFSRLLNKLKRFFNKPRMSSTLRTGVNRNKAINSQIPNDDEAAKRRSQYKITTKNVRKIFTPNQSNNYIRGGNHLNSAQPIQTSATYNPISRIQKNSTETLPRNTGKTMSANYSSLNRNNHPNFNPRNYMQQRNTRGMNSMGKITLSILTPKTDANYNAKRKFLDERKKLESEPPKNNAPQIKEENLNVGKFEKILKNHNPLKFVKNRYPSMITNEPREKRGSNTTQEHTETPSFINPQTPKMNALIQENVEKLSKNLSTIKEIDEKGMTKQTKQNYDLGITGSSSKPSHGR